MNTKTRWNILMVAVLILGSGWTLVSRLPAEALGGQVAPRQGFFAPDFTLKLLEGGQITLSELRGQVVVVNFWASWCPPCRAEMPAIERVFQGTRAQGVSILGVNTTFQDNEAEAAAFVQECGLSFPILLDRDGAVSDQYALEGMPTTFFIDPQGVIRQVIVGGPLSEATIQSIVAEILREVP